MGVGQDWVWFDVEKECGGKEDEALLTHHTERQSRKIADTNPFLSRAV